MREGGWWRIGGEEYRLVVQRASQRFFCFEGARPHTHPEFHFVLVSQGQCRMVLSEDLAVECPVNTLVFINPLLPHTFSSDARGVEHSCLIGALRREGGEAYTGTLQAMLGLPEPHAPWSAARLDAARARSFIEHLRRINRLTADGPEAAADAARWGWFLQCAQWTFPEVFSQPRQRTRNEEIVERLRRVIEDNLHRRDLSVQDLCRQMELSRNHLHRMFRAVEGCGIGEYLIFRRLERAAVLLAGGAPVTRAWRECGFGGHSHFSAMFRRRFGVSPKTYAGEEG